MKTLSFTKKSLVALSVAAATIIYPVTASAQNFQSRSNNNTAGAQIAGGLIGGSLGAVLGEEIAGRGNRTEGAVLGAIIGGVAGAAVGEGIASDNNNGRRVSNRRINNRGFNNRGFNNRGFNNRNRGFRNRGFNNRGFSNRGFGNTGFVTQISTNRHGFNDFGHNDFGYVYGRRTSANTYRKIDKIDYRIDELKYEQKAIYNELEYRGHDRRLKDRLDYIDCEIVELRDRRRFLKRKLRKSRDFY